MTPLVALALLLSAAVEVEPERVLVLDFAAVGVDETVAKSANAAVAESFTGKRGYAVITSAELRELVDLESDKELLGCNADASCVAEISRYANAGLVVTGSVGKVGATVTLSLSLIATDTATVKNRVSGQLDASDARGADALAETARRLVAELFGWEGAATGPRFSLPKGEKVSFAVFPLKVAGVSEEIARNLTQILSAEIKQVEGASVVGKEDVAALLQLESDKAALGCTEDESCLAEIGGALGVDKLVIGQVGKVADSYVLALRLVDARAVRVDNRITESFVGPEAQLIRAVAHAGRTLLGIDAGEPGTLAVSASERGARVVVDGEERGELPMAPVDGLTPGRHSLKLTHDGFLDWNGDVYVDPGDTTAQWVVLERKPAQWFENPWLWGIGVPVVVGTLAGAAITTGLLINAGQEPPARGKVLFSPP